MPVEILELVIGLAGCLIDILWASSAVGTGVAAVKARQNRKRWQGEATDPHAAGSAERG